MNRSRVHLIGNAGQPVTENATQRLPALPDAGQWAAALNRIAVLEESVAELQPLVWQMRQDTDALLLTVRVRPPMWTRAGQWIGRWLFRMVSHANATR